MLLDQGHVLLELRPGQRLRSVHAEMGLGSGTDRGTEHAKQPGMPIGDRAPELS